MCCIHVVFTSFTNCHGNTWRGYPKLFLQCWLQISCPPFPVPALARVETKVDVSLTLPLVLKLLLLLEDSYILLFYATLRLPVSQNQSQTFWAR